MFERERGAASRAALISSYSFAPRDVRALLPPPLFKLSAICFCTPVAFLSCHTRRRSFKTLNLIWVVLAAAVLR